LQGILGRASHSDGELATFTRESFDPAWLRNQGAPLVVKASAWPPARGW